jgi:hypothetical protein
LGGRLISFPEIIIAPNGSVGPTAYTVGGQARLSFSTNPPDAGRVTFMPVDGYPTDVNTARFVDYKEVYNTVSRTLTVSFTINFPTCSLPFSAKYRN